MISAEVVARFVEVFSEQIINEFLTERLCYVVVVLLDPDFTFIDFISDLLAGIVLDLIMIYGSWMSLILF
jgi:hypothetical protein